MEKYNDLELAVMSCILQKPELMENVILEDKHFINNQKIWLFMKAFYKRYKNFDLTLMVNISKNKFRMVEYIIWLIDKEPAPSLFEAYQKELIDMYNETKQNKYLREKFLSLANDFYLKNITLDELLIMQDEVIENSSKI